MALIDKDALIAEIDDMLKSKEQTSHSDKDAFNSGRWKALKKVKDIIDTLEVKGINFEDTKSVFKGQYLSKDKVVTTIERLQDECEEHNDNNGVELLEKLFNKLSTLEVKEVDLEHEVESYWKQCDMTWCRDAYSMTHTRSMLSDIAKHFYELGLKAVQKGE